MINCENMDISSKSDTTVRSYEASLPKETLTQRYIFSDKTDYVSAAGTYRDYLTNRYPELVKKEDTTVPMAVELLGAVDNTEHILGSGYFETIERCRRRKYQSQIYRLVQYRREAEICCKGKTGWTFGQQE